MNKLIEKEINFYHSFDDTPIYYEIHGKGEPLIFVYGIGCLINHWRHQIKAFSQNYQVIVYDLRGHHKSPAPENKENLNLDSLSLDLQCLMKHLKLKNASFWGHSFGAQILIRAYDMNPKMFNSLVFVNGFASNPIEKLFGLNIVSPGFEIFKQGYQALPETFKQLWTLSINNPLAMKLASLIGGFNEQLIHIKDIEIYARGVSSIDIDVFLKLFEQIMKYDGTPVLERIKTPTLIISGRDDTITPEKYQVLLHEGIKNSQFFSVPYGSHCTQLDLPDFVNLRIEQFLKSNVFKS